MSVWERAPFAISLSDHEIHEAVLALRRVMDNTAIGAATRIALIQAIEQLREE